MQQARKFFAEKYGLSDADLDRYLSAALAHGGDYADLYFEYRSTSSISLDESLIKGTTQGVSVGCGVRVISGERTGYAYTDDLSSEKVLQAARLASHISSGPSKLNSIGLQNQDLPRSLYPVLAAPTDLDLATKLDLVWRADKAARAYDPRIVQVRAGYADEVRTILNVTSEGGVSGDYQPDRKSTRLNSSHT